MTNQVKTAAAMIAVGLLASNWLLASPAQSSRAARYDLAIASGTDLQLAPASAARVMAPTSARTLACVSVLRLGIFDAGFQCVSTSTAMAARAMRRDAAAYVEN